MTEKIIHSSDYERAKAEESIAKNEANRKIVELTSERAYEEQEEKDAQNLLLIDYVYNNSKENGTNSFEVVIGNETVVATVRDGKIAAVVKGKNVEIEITKKLSEVKINKDTRDYLAKHYSNTMFMYGNMYYLLQKSLGAPKRIKFKDLKTGKKIPLYHENGDPMSSSLRCVTPSTSVEIEFTDKYGKSMYLTLPGIKNVERAIEKVKEGGKYYMAYKEDAKNIRIKFASEDEAFVPEIKKFIEKQKENPFINKDIQELNTHYSTIISYYLKELKGKRFLPQEKKQELIYKKDLHKIEMLVKQKKIDVIDTIRKVYDMAMSVSKYEKGVENYFYDGSLFSKYLSEFEEIFTSSSEKNNKKYNIGEGKDRSSEYKDLLDVYYKFLGGNTAYIKEMSSVRKPHERLRDIFRCSIIVRYYDNIPNIKAKFHDSLRSLHKDDKFYGNNDPRHEGFKKSRGYRDDKVIYEKRKKDDNFDIAFETQFKIATLGEEDFRTHQLYQEIRVLEEELRDCYDIRKVNLLKASITAKKLEIRNIYGKVLNKYNNKVLETAAEMEVDLFRKEWKEKLDVPKDLETLKKLNKERAEAECLLRNSNQTMPEVEKFIRDNLLVSPFEALNIKSNIINIKGKDYSEKTKKIEQDANGEFLIIKDEVETKVDMKNFARRYFNDIKKAYAAIIIGELPSNYFDDYDKALEEKIKQDGGNTETIGGSTYQNYLKGAERKKINQEESDYLGITYKEKVAETPKKVDTGFVIAKENLRKRTGRG